MDIYGTQIQQIFHIEENLALSEEPCLEIWMQLHCQLTLSKLGTSFLLRWEQTWIIPRRVMLCKPFHPSGHSTREIVTMIKDDLVRKAAWEQIYCCPAHTTLFLSPKDIFPIKSNVRKGHTQPSMLIRPFLVPSDEMDTQERGRTIVHWETKTLGTHQNCIKCATSLPKRSSWGRVFKSQWSFYKWETVYPDDYMKGRTGVYINTSINFKKDRKSGAFKWIDFVKITASYFNLLYCLKMKKETAKFHLWFKDKVVTRKIRSDNKFSKEFGDYVPNSFEVKSFLEAKSGGIERVSWIWS